MNLATSRKINTRLARPIAYLFVLLGFNFTLTSVVILRQCLLVTLVLWPMCCHTGMPCHTQRTWYPTPSQYTDTGTTCRCVIHWCGTSHWNILLPIWISDLTFHTHQWTLNFIMLLWWWSVRSSVESVPYPLSLEPRTCGVRIIYPINHALYLNSKGYITLSQCSFNGTLNSEYSLSIGTAG